MVDDPTTPGQIVGRNVRAVREELLLSQRELAERSGVAKITIATLELGRSAHPRRRTVEKLAAALGVQADDLIRKDLTRPKAEGRSSPEPTLFNGLEQERLPRSREESAFVIVGREVEGELRMAVLWNVPPEERDRYRPTLRIMLPEGFIEDELPAQARELLVGAGG